MMRTLALLLALLAHAPAWGWSNDGHRITGVIATQLLTPQAKTRVRELLGHDDLPSIATWMDDERETLAARWPDSPRWHYENRPACGGGNPSACRQGHCITAQLARFVALLRDKQADRAARADALRVVVHLIGDLHQPLHLADNNDRGGNDVWALLPGEVKPIRLHEVWDRTLLRRSMNRGANGRSAAVYARSLLRQHQDQVAVWQQGSVELWASETRQLGAQSSYGLLPGFQCPSAARRESSTVSLTKEYIDTAQSITDVQLVKAGARLAAVLNASLNDAAP